MGPTRKSEEGPTMVEQEESKPVQKLDVIAVKKWIAENADAMRERRAEQTIVWPMLINFVTMYLYALYGFYLFPFMKWQSWIWVFIAVQMGTLGTTAGAHRLWAHRTYTASTPLRIILGLWYTFSGQNSLYAWVRDHRVHHTFPDTDIDPHNASRGFFYSHVGWLIVKRHPDSHRILRQVDMDDILKDPVAAFVTKYHQPLVIVLCFILPTFIPYYFWGETLKISFSVAIARWVGVINGVFAVNSFAHLYGTKPFNKNILPSQNIYVSFFGAGEGWHNYHHMFPWDFRTSETGYLNLTMHFIRLCKYLGLASDLKTASPDLVNSVMMKYGDGTHPNSVADLPVIPIEALADASFLATLPTPKFNKHQ